MAITFIRPGLLLLDRGAAAGLGLSLLHGLVQMRSTSTSELSATTELRPCSCQQLFLQACRYLQLWQSLGHATLGYMPRTETIVSPTLGDRAVRGFLRQLQDFQAQNSNVVLHIFRSAHAAGDVFVMAPDFLNLAAMQASSSWGQPCGRWPCRTQRCSNSC